MKGPVGEVAQEGTPIVAPGAVPTVYTTRSNSTLTVDVVVGLNPYSTCKRPTDMMSLAQMGCVCSGLLALALILGGINIYKIYKLEEQQSQLGSR